jgi:serine protease Do
MIRRFLICMSIFAVILTLGAAAQPGNANRGVGSNLGSDEWDWNYSSDDSSGSSYLGVDIADVSPERLSALKLKEEHGVEVTMVDQDAPAGKAGLHEHDVILSMNGTAVESAAQLRRMIKETPSGRIVSIGISRDGAPMTIKVQLADRSKSMSNWNPKNFQYHYEMPKIPPMPDIDIPVSVVVVHSSARSGLMVENITPQLGEFFGIKGGNGVLVRSVEKGSNGDKAGFRAGDVVVKVNDQLVHDSSDFMHSLHAASGSSVSVTVMRDRREQNLTLPIPDKKDSGENLEDSFEVPEMNAAMQEAMDRAGEEIARMTPAIREKMSSECLKDLERRMNDSEKAFEDSARSMEDQRKKWQEREQKLEKELRGAWTEI